MERVFDHSPANIEAVRQQTLANYRSLTRATKEEPILNGRELLHQFLKDGANMGLLDPQLMRRWYLAQLLDERVYSYRGYTLDLANKIVTLPDQRTKNLTPKETGMLHPMIAFPGRAIPITLLFQYSGWPEDGPVSMAQYVRVHISRLRGKLEDSKDKEGWNVIKTVKAGGYRFSPPSLRAGYD